MIKKIYLFFIIGILIFGCGKKGDPIYKESKLELSNAKFVMVLWDINQKIFQLMDFMQVK